MGEDEDKPAPFSTGNLLAALHLVRLTVGGRLCSWCSHEEHLAVVGGTVEGVLGCAPDAFGVVEGVLGCALVLLAQWKAKASGAMLAGGGTKGGHGSKSGSIA